MRRLFIIILILCTLTGCSLEPEDITRQTTTVHPLNTITSSPYIQPSATIKISPTVIEPVFQPMLGGSEAWIEKNFKLRNYQFFQTIVDESTMTGLGLLTLKKENGDPFDIFFQINTRNSGDDLTRAEISALLPQPPTKQEMDVILENFKLFYLTSMNINDNGIERSKWLDEKLTALNLKENQEYRTNIDSFLGNTQIRLLIAPWTSDSNGGVAYELILWVDPIASEVNDTVHISGELTGKLNGIEKMTLSCWDYEDPDIVTWSTCPETISSCESNNPAVKLTNSTITVYEKFPVTYDQWLLKVQVNSESTFPAFTLQIDIHYQGEDFTCTNRGEMSGVFYTNRDSYAPDEANIFLETADGEINLESREMICHQN